MKTLLAIAFSLSMCCLLTSNGMAADATKPAKDAAVKASAVSGIALTTHRPGGGDHGFGVAPSTFGEIVRHDIKDNRVVGSRVIYPGKARAAFIDPSGERVVFIKLDGRLHVMKADGTGLKELAKARKLECGTMVSPSGQYVTEMQGTHADLNIWSWDLGTLLTEFRVNAWAGASGDGRNYLYRPRWSANSDKWVVMTHGVDFGCTERSNAALYNWKEQIQIQLTRNPLDGKASDEGESFWLAGLPVDFSVIELGGKAPCTIELKSPKVEGEGWKWDFGDGATGSGAVGRHTYTQPGDYIATARKGQSTLRQRVLVLPRKAPRATAASALDSRHVLVDFEEPVKIEGAAVKLASGRAATKLHLDPLGRQLVAEFDQPLAAKEILVLEKITDRAQVPNAVANPQLPVQRPSWPADATGLVFRWKNAKAENRLWDPVLGGVRETLVRNYGGACFNRVGAALATGGMHFDLHPESQEHSISAAIFRGKKPVPTF